MGSPTSNIPDLSGLISQKLSFFSNCIKNFVLSATKIQKILSQRAEDPETVFALKLFEEDKKQIERFLKQLEAVNSYLTFICKRMPFPNFLNFRPKQEILISFTQRARRLALKCDSSHRIDPQAQRCRRLISYHQRHETKPKRLEIHLKTFKLFCYLSWSFHLFFFLILLLFIYSLYLETCCLYTLSLFF